MAAASVSGSIQEKGFHPTTTITKTDGVMDNWMAYGSTDSSPPPLVEVAPPPTSPPGPPVFKTYWWRWMVLAVFMLNHIANNLLWITFAPVADVMRCYYGINNNVVNALSLASAVLTIFLVLPSAWALIHFGIRFTVVLSSAATALGAGLRVAGAGSGYFSLLMAGQIVSSFNGLMEGSVTLLSETWFSSSERATATALSASISPQLGVLLGYALGPTIIHSEIEEEVCYTNATYTPTPSPGQAGTWQDSTYQQIFYYLLGQAIFSIVVLFITLFAFPEAPPTPPSLSRKNESESSSLKKLSLYQRFREFIISFSLFLSNGYFILFLISTGILIGAGGTMGTIINEMVLPYYPHEERMIAYLGITMKVSSVVGLLLTGRILDWTKAFYGVWVSVYWMAAVSIATFTAVVVYQKHIYPLYIAIGMVGWSFSSFQVVALEYAVEMTYPLPEGTSNGLVNLFSMITATVLILVFGKLSDSGHMLIGTWVIAGMVALGAFIAVFVKPKLRRANIDNPSSLNQDMNKS